MAEKEHNKQSKINKSQQRKDAFKDNINKALRKTGQFFSNLGKGIANHFVNKTVKDWIDTGLSIGSGYTIGRAVPRNQINLPNNQEPIRNMIREIIMEEERIPLIQRHFENSGNPGSY